MKRKTSNKGTEGEERYSEERYSEDELETA